METKVQGGEVVTPNGTVPEFVLSGNLAKASLRWCAVDRLPLRSAPDENAKVLGELEFLEPVTLAEGYPEKSQEPYACDQQTREANTDWALVCYAMPGTRRVQSLRGWVPRRYLIDRLTAEFDPEHKVHKKAIIVDNAELLQRGEVLQPVQPSWSIPVAHTGSNKNSTSLNLYRMLYVYAEFGGQLLVATLPEIEDPLLSAKRLREDILGWVPTDRVARWNTRECLEWDRNSFSDREVKGMLFETEEDAISAITKITINNPSGGVDAAEEPEHVVGSDGKVNPLSNGALRFHLLTNFREAQNQRTRFQKPIEWQRQNPKNELFELGCVISLDGKGVDIESEQDRIARLAAETADTEILFVIDDTGSMDVALIAVKDIVPQLVDEIRTNAGGGNVFVTIVFYNNAAELEKAVQVTTVKQLKITDDNVGTISNTLALHKMAPPGKSPLVRVFDAIQGGLKAADFQRNSRKMLFLLGDCGDERGMPEEQNQLTPGLTRNARQQLERIAKMLLPRDGSPTECHILQMQDPELNNVDSKPYFKMLHGQLNVGLRSEYSKQLREMFEEHDERPNTEDFLTYAFFDTPAQQDNMPLGKELLRAKVTKFVQSNVVGKIINARDKGQTYRKLIKSVVLSGNAVEMASADLAVLKRILDLEGVNDFITKYKDVKPYQRMYGWHRCPVGNPGVPQLRRMVLVNYRELDIAMKILGKLELEYNGGREIDFAGAARGLFEVQAGGLADFGNAKTDHEKAKILFTALRFHSPVFNIFNQGRAGAKIAIDSAEMNKLFIKRRLLEAIIDKQETTAENYVQDNKGIWQLKTGFQPNIRDRAFTRDGTKTEHFYVDFETEWP